MIPAFIYFSCFVIALVIAALILNKLRFEKMINREIIEFLDGIPKGNMPNLTPVDLKGLPMPVSRWLERSGVVGKHRIRSVRLKQKGILRTNKEKGWMPFEAVQYFRTDKPGFIWHAKVKIAPLIGFVGRDKVVDGKGYMLIKLLSLIPVVNAQGPEIDQGAMLRFLGEMAWFPGAALSSWVRWEPEDERTARATLIYGDLNISGLFHFDDEGDLIGITANRYYEIDGRYRLTPWSVSMGEIKDFASVRIPSHCVVTWNLESGDFEWFRVDITELDYNV